MLKAARQTVVGLSYPGHLQCELNKAIAPLLVIVIAGDGCSGSVKVIALVLNRVLE